jgi:hypothetical protein
MLMVLSRQTAAFKGLIALAARTEQEFPFFQFG